MKKPSYPYLFTLSFFLTSIGLFSLNLQSQSKDYALLIAIDQYDHWSPLNNPAKDARAIGKDLREIYGFEVEIITNPDQVTIFDKLQEYRKKTYHNDSQLFIFMSGHGEFIEETKEGFFIPKNGKLDDYFGMSYIPHSRLEKAVDFIPCKHILLAIDACYSGTFDEAIAMMKGRPTGDLNELARQSREVFIKRTLRVKSRLYLTSGGKERTPDGTIHSPFTMNILKGLRTYGGDDNILTYTELLSYMEYTDPQPRTGQFGSHEINGGFLFIVRNPDYLMADSGSSKPANNPVGGWEPPKTSISEREPAPPPTVQPILNPPELSEPDQEQLDKGILAIQNNNISLAKSTFLEMYNRKVKSPTIYEALYELYKTENKSQAFQYLREGRTIFPEEVPLLFLEINHLLAKGKLNELIELLEKAIQKEPDNISLYRTLGNVYESLYDEQTKAGNLQLAEKHWLNAKNYYEMAVNKAPGDSDALYSMGALYYNLAATKTLELNELADDFTKEGTKKYNAIKQEVSDLFDIALPYFQNAESVNPNDRSTLIALKEIYAQKNNLSRANEFKDRLDKVQSGEKIQQSFFSN